jgi:hypothetical protein
MYLFVERQMLEVLFHMLVPTPKEEPNVNEDTLSRLESRF